MTFKTIADEFPVEPFERKHLRDLVAANNESECIEYINKYFFKTLDGFIFFNVVDFKTQIKNLNIDKINNYLPKKMRMFDNKGKVKFDIQEWFVNENDELYQFTFSPGRPAIFTECRVNYINFFIDPKHTIQPYSDYDNKTKEGVDFILNHIYDVLCDGDNTLYNYMLNWFANLCMFKKNETCLYLKSGKGTGKSIFIDKFINHMVLQHLAYTTSNVDIITGYNQGLRDKTLLVLEEVPAESKGQWHAFNQRILDLITGSTIDIRQRYKDELTIKNHLSVIVITNRNGIAFSTDNRRFVLAQISDKRVGDTDYFNKFASIIKNKNVSSAFFTLMRERYVKENISKFDFRTLPKTDADKELHIENLPQHYQFVKDEYIAKNRDFKDTVAETYEKYLKYFKGTHPVKKNTFGKHFKPLGFIVAQKTINKKPCKVWDTSFDEMVKIFEAKGWIHEDDDVGVGDVVELNYKKELYECGQRNIELQARIEELEAQLFELRNAQ